MSIATQTLQLQFTSFIPAILRENKAGWYIEYYCENPLTKKLERKTIKMNWIAKRFSNKKDARRHIQAVINSINIKLSKGWNPFFEAEDARLYTSINDVLSFFIREKEKELRDNTLRSYKSFVSIFLEWISSYDTKLYSSLINFPIAARFMDYVYNERNVGQTSYNNYLKMGRAIFNWMVEKNYTKENPFNKIKPKAKPKKKRILIDPETRKRIYEYLDQNNNNFLLVCKLIFASLLRPNEIRQLRIEDINLAKHYITIKDDVAKNHKMRFAAITQDIIDDLLKLKLINYPSNYFLFSGDLLPGPNMSGNARFRKEWDKVRSDLKIPQEMQLYSFRDSGIFEMIKYSGIDDLSVMQHADHHSLDITTVYANHFDSNLIDLIYQKAPQF